MSSDEYESNSLSINYEVEDKTKGDKGSAVDADNRKQCLKKSRTGFKSALRKRRNELRELIKDESNLEEVKTKLNELQQPWEKFEDAHKKLHDILTEDDEIDESYQYYDNEVSASGSMREKIVHWVMAVEDDKHPMLTDYENIKPEDSISQVSASHASKVSKFSKISMANSSSSSVKGKLIEETATRKALEAKLRLIEEGQMLAERKLQLQKQMEQEELYMKQEQELLNMKVELAQCMAREEVYAQAEANEHGELLYPDKTNDYPIKAKTEHTVKPEVKTEDSSLNPIAPEWHDGTHQDDTLPPRMVKKEVELDESFMKQDNFVKIMIIQERQTKCIEELVAQQQRSSLALSLPKPEVPIFSGDPIEYCNFVRAFETLIEARTDSNSTRLYYLVQYTSGAVQELMQSCSLMNPDEGYSEARKLLKGRYGQDYKIASAYINKVISGLPIKSEDGAALQKFSVLLTSCKNTLKETGYINKIENPDCLIRGIIQRLPYDARRRWRFSADNISEKENRQITLDDIAHFVEREARAATHPVFGDISSDTKDKDADKNRFPHSGSKRSSFAALVDEDGQRTDDGTEKNEFYNQKPIIRCILCYSPHKLEECKAFQDKPYDERMVFAKKKGLCFNCLIPRHRAKECRRGTACANCGRKHATLLHSPPSTTNDVKSEDVNQEPTRQVNNGFVETRKTPHNAVKAGRSKVGLAVVPVKVKAEGMDAVVVTYAFLDGGSNSTFCTETLLKQLGLQGKKIEFSLTTLERENSVTKSSVVSLELLDLEEENFLELPTVFSVQSLPVSFEDIPKQEDVDRWAHLRGVRVSELEVPVGLLIGNDNIKALEPKEFKESKDGGPCATRTCFGWAINGPLGCNGGEKKHTANVIKTDHDLDQQFQSFCNREFSENIAESKLGMSKEDHKATAIMEQSVELKNNHYQIALPWRDTPPQLPNNRSMALHRLSLLKKRFLKDPELFKRYSTVIEDLLHKGFAQTVPEGEIDRQDGFLWYLPHHPVINDDPMTP